MLKAAANATRAPGGAGVCERGMRWHARAAVGAVGAISLLELRAGAAVVAIGVGGVRGYSDAVLAIGGGGRGTLGPQSAQSEP